MPGGPLNLNSTNLPRPWSPWESSQGRAGNRIRDLMISSQRLEGVRNCFIFLGKTLKSTKNKHISGLLKKTEGLDQNRITISHATFEFSKFSLKTIPNIKAQRIFERTCTL